MATLDLTTDEVLLIGAGLSNLLLNAKDSLFRGELINKIQEQYNAQQVPQPVEAEPAAPVSN